LLRKIKKNIIITDTEDISDNNILLTDLILKYLIYGDIAGER